MKDKVLIIYVTRNNHIFVQQFVSSLEKYNPGYEYELLIVDNSSDDKSHLTTLEQVGKKYLIETYENDRVEVSFAIAGTKNIHKYKYYLFLHDDTMVNCHGWLKAFVDRANSGYVEKQIEGNEISKLPIGRVGACHQFYRTYTEMMGIKLESRFIKDVLEKFKNEVPAMYKFVDPERVLYTNDCLATSGLISLKWFDFGEIQEFGNILNKYLTYYDEGISPKNKYPPGKWWNKSQLLVEFLNSVMPLVHGFRSVGLEGDGYAEHIDGYSAPFSHKYIYHLGSPNMKQFLGKCFGVSADDIHKKIYSKDRAFLIQCDKLIKRYFNG